MHFLVCHSIVIPVSSSTFFTLTFLTNCRYLLANRNLFFFSAFSDNYVTLPFKSVCHIQLACFHPSYSHPLLASTPYLLQPPSPSQPSNLNFFNPLLASIHEPVPTSTSHQHQPLTCFNPPSSTPSTQLSTIPPHLLQPPCLLLLLTCYSPLL